MSDHISRAAAIEALEKSMSHEDGLAFVTEKHVREILNDLPSVPEPPNDAEKVDLTKFCPKCGYEGTCQ